MKQNSRTRLHLQKMPSTLDQSNFSFHSCICEVPLINNTPITTNIQSIFVMPLRILEKNDYNPRLGQVKNQYQIHLNQPSILPYRNPGVALNIFTIKISIMLLPFVSQIASHQSCPLVYNHNNTVTFSVIRFEQQQDRITAATSLSTALLPIAIITCII